MCVLSFKTVILSYKARKNFLTVGGVRITVDQKTAYPFVLIVSRLGMNSIKLGSVRFLLSLLNNQRLEKHKICKS